jgi:hypothetical protein
MMFNRRRGVILTGVLTAVAFSTPLVIGAAKVKRFSGPLSSQPLAISADDRILAVVNPDNNTVSLFNLEQNRKFAE